MTMDGDGDAGGAMGDVAFTTVPDEAPSMSAEADEAFLSRLALIEDQPLGDRARAFSQLVDELRTHLESGDGEPRRPGG